MRRIAGVILGKIGLLSRRVRSCRVAPCDIFLIILRESGGNVKVDANIYARVRVRAFLNLCMEGTLSPRGGMALPSWGMQCSLVGNSRFPYA